MIVVTGATGTVGSYVVKNLVESGVMVRALTRNPESQKYNDQVEWVRADFDEPKSIRDSLQGATEVVLITPAHRDMVKHQRMVVDASVECGVRKIAKLSGLGAGEDALIRLPKNHYQIEKYIQSRPIDYAFVRPNLFMQVLLGAAENIRSERVVYAPSGDGAISFTNAEDVANVLVSELKKPGSSVHEITGPKALTYQQVADIVGSKLGRDVQHVDVTEEQARISMRSSGMDEWLIDAFVELFGVYRKGMGGAVLSDEIERSTGKKPVTFERFVEENLGVFM